jgi:GT2 family glycosyltransferase
MTSLSLCIVNWNTRDFLRECLASIEEYPFDGDMEVIVLDNASTDGSPQMVRIEFPKVCLIANHQNVGYADGNNQAFEKASGEWLLLLNPDVRLLPNTLTNAVKTASSLPDFGALGIKQIGPDNRLQKSVRSFPDPQGVLCELLQLGKLFPRNRALSSYRMGWFDYRGTIEVDQPMATFLLTTREVVDEVGGLDPNFPIFFNDVDWCRRVSDNGKKIYFTDEAQIVHYGGAGTSKAKRSTMVVESKESFLRYYVKHYQGKLPTSVYNAVDLSVRLSIRAQRLRDLITNK